MTRTAARRGCSTHVLRVERYYNLLLTLMAFWFEADFLGSDSSLPIIRRDRKVSRISCRLEAAGMPDEPALCSRIIWAIIRALRTSITLEVVP